MKPAARRRRGALGPWEGRAFLGVGWAFYLGPAGDTTPHAHHALQVSVGLDGPFRLRHGEGRWQDYDSALVPADVPHQLDGGWADLLLLYVEPESAESRPWLSDPREEIHALDAPSTAAIRDAVRELVRSPPDATRAAGIFRERLRQEGDGARPPSGLDPRIAEAVERLRTMPNARGALRELARAVGLSASRFRHVFRREIGMSAQSYVVWLRLYDACAELARGGTFSDAAYSAGFSDAAHFTRTFRRTFGLAPSQLAGRLTLIEPHTRSEDPVTSGAHLAR